MSQANKILTAIGLMSGTSFDGVDAAIVKTDGEKIQELGTTFSLLYTEEFRQKIRALLKEELNVKLLVEVESELTKLHAVAVSELLSKAKLKSNDIDLLGFHGQAIYHDPDNGYSLHVGNPSLLAALTSINVVADFRRKDIALGGQGAPLVPLFHQALFDTVEKPVAIINIGGVANITYLGAKPKSEIVAFDCGPGGALIDDLMYRLQNVRFDEGGEFARSGEPYHEALAAFCEDNYFTRKPPKSLDRNAFAYIIRDLLRYTKLKPQDIVATATHFAAEGINQSVKFLPDKPKLWLVCGGGRHNKYLLEILKNKYSFNVIPVDQITLPLGPADGNFTEAQAFGFLAVRSYYNLPLSMPATTGVSRPTSGGAFYRS